MARANAVRARGNALPPEGLPPGEILDSWVRCMGSRLDPGAPVQVPVVGAGALAQRRERAAFVRRLAQAELETRATLGDGALERLARHGWPGNFRELRAVLTRALLARHLRGDTAVIGVDDLDAVLPGAGAAAGPGLRGGYGSALRVGHGSALRDVQGSASRDAPGSALRDRPGSALPGTSGSALRGTSGSALRGKSSPALRGKSSPALRAEATERVCREFERCGRSVSRTSRSLVISRTTVYRHLREGGVVPQR